MQRDNMNLREERGAFWWHDEPIPQGQPAPASSVAGQLFVDDEGRSRLELDGNLPRGTKNSPKPPGFDPMPEGTAIRGVIKDKNQHVLLSTLHRSGFNYSIMSHETFRAENCIIGDKPFPAGDAFSQLRSLEIDLTGFDAWLGLQSIAFTSKRGSITVKYKMPKDLVYPLDDGKLSIRYYVNRPPSWISRTHALTLTELATLHYGFSSPRTLEEANLDFSNMGSASGLRI
jgi:ApeA N-terminal domain 1